MLLMGEGANERAIMANLTTGTDNLIMLGMALTRQVKLGHTFVP